MIKNSTWNWVRGHARHIVAKNRSTFACLRLQGSPVSKLWYGFCWLLLDRFPVKIMSKKNLVCSEKKHIKGGGSQRD